MAGCLLPEVTFQVRDAIVSSRIYDALKEAVISRTAHTDGQRIRQLLQGFQLGSKYPQSHCGKCGGLRGEQFGDDPMSRVLWLQRLPLYIPHSISTARNCSQEGAAEIAVSRYSPGVSALDAFSSPRATSSPLQGGLTTILMRISASLQLLTVDRDGPPDQFSPPRGRNRRLSPKRPFLPSAEGKCKYHNRFGGSAKDVTLGAYARVTNRETRLSGSGRGTRHRAISTSCLLHNVKDLTTNRLLLVDTGAEISVISRDPNNLTSA